MFRNLLKWKWVYIGSLVLLALVAEIFAHQSEPKTGREKEINEIYDSIPKNEAEIKTYTKEALKEFDAAVAAFLKIPARNFDNTILGWNTIVDEINAKKLMLLFTHTESTKSQAEESATELGNRLKEAMSGPEIINVMLEFAEGSFTPSERPYVLNVVQTLYHEPLKSRVQKLQDDLLQQEMLPYTFKQGDAEEKIFKGNSFTVLNFNTCFFGNKLPMVFGGLLPWKLRIDEIVERIKAHDPDIICLQELFDIPASPALYERLKDRYRYFYFNISPRNAGLKVEALGISSGLFIASKYELDSPTFIPFGQNSPPERSYGFFDAKVVSKGKVLGHVVTTHLQPFDESGQPWREKQMTQIINYMSAQKDGAASILCGDLNILWGSAEPAEILMKENFFNESNLKTTKITFENRTCCDYTNYWWKDRRNIKEFKTTPEIYDYALLLMTDKMTTITTKIISMSDPKLPEEALSDHQALITHVEVSISE